MRELLYLSENKMRALVPQLPGRLRRRLGFEAGLSAGVATVTATLPSEPQSSSIALLDAVVRMIEKNKGTRRRTSRDLRAGDWIQFEDEFRYGDAATAPYTRLGEDPDRALSGLVYFATTNAGPPFVLCGSSVHVLDRWQSGDTPEKRVGWFYMDALLAYARKLAELRDESANTEFVPPPVHQGRSLATALSALCRTSQFGGHDRDQWAAGPAQLCGHARVLAVIPTHDGPPWVLATPLYVE